MGASAFREGKDRGTSDRIKVVRIIARLIVGGPTSHVVTLTEGLDASRFESLLIVGRPNRDEESLVPWARGRGLRPRELDSMVGELSVKARDMRAMAALYRLMRCERPHIVHTHTAKAGVLGRVAAWLAGVPIVVHTYHGHILHGYFSTHVNVGLRVMERWLGRRTHCIVAVSEAVRKDLLRYRIAEPSKIRTIPLGVALDPFMNQVRRSGEFRREIGAREAQPLVGIVGRVAPIKDHRLFLRALRRVMEWEGRALGVIVGDGPCARDARAFAKGLGIANRVVFTGWRRDLPRIYSDLDVLVVSSRNEGTPVSIIEAMASGCPVVAAAVGGIPDMISDGETGRLVRPGDDGALAEGIRKTLMLTAESSRMAGRARASVSRYGATRLVADVEQLYEELVATWCIPQGVTPFSARTGEGAGARRSRAWWVA